MNTKYLGTIISAAALVLAATSLPLRASDHADGPTVAGDQAADLADAYMFVDPNDSTKVVIINTVRGFIVPGEAVNFALFDSSIRYRFQIENTGPVDARGRPIPAPGPLDLDFDPKPDAFIDLTFSEKNTTGPQTATVVFSGSAFAGIPKGKYVGTTTVAGLGTTPPGGANYFPATPQKLKAAPKKSTDSPGDEINVEFFAGESDDPFFFDIPGFSRFRTRYLANLATIPGGFADRVAALTDAAVELQRGRDTFAGYNVMVMAFRIPIAQLRSKDPKVNLDNTKFGLNVLAQRKIEKTVKGAKVGIGTYSTVDREGLPAINALLVPLARKNAFNGATTLDDAKGAFAFDRQGNPIDIAATLLALQVQGTVSNPLTPLGLLAKLAVLDGDILRIDTSIASNSPGAHFPNGRRPEDDVVKTLLSVIASNVIPPDIAADDSVETNDVGFSPNFPYLGLPHQPRVSADPNDASATDDSTEN